MGTTYDYVSFTRRERFPIDTFGGSAKFGGIGRSLGSRAFELLLIQGPTPSHGVGRWAKNVVALVGDSDDEWEVTRQFANIKANIIQLMIQIDGFDEIAKLAGDARRGSGSTDLFMQLSYLGIMRQIDGLDELMRRTFDTYPGSFKRLCEERVWWHAVDIVPVADSAASPHSGPK